VLGFTPTLGQVRVATTSEWKMHHEIGRKKIYSPTDKKLHLLLLVECH
jgi:hypothetical protein